jgi:hypothetical protein
VHDHGKPARQGDNGFLPATAFGHIHRPGFQPGPFDGAGQHDLRRFIEKRPHHAVATLRNPAYKGAACFGKTAIAPRQRVKTPPTMTPPLLSPSALISFEKMKFWRGHFSRET